jgi:hypothetical protein
VYEFYFKPRFIALCLPKKNLGFFIEGAERELTFYKGEILIKPFRMKILGRLI